MTPPESPALDETLLKPCSPSALLRRDEGCVRDGTSPALLAEMKGVVTAVALGQVPASSPPPASELRARVLASLTRKGHFGVFAEKLSRMFDIPMTEAETLAAKLEDPTAWQPFLVPGVEMITLTPGPRYPGAIATIARLQPGSRFPEHVHRGEETMFLLDGGFREEGEHGEEVWRGDEMHRTDGTGHTFVALPGVPCIAASLVIGVVDFT